MNPDYIIVQAGGMGTRLGSLTKNKPKALVSVENLPILFHLFKLYPDKHFIVIGDYKIDVLRRYLATFASVDYEVVEAQNGKGTCAGLGKAIDSVPDDEPFLLIWCDLMLSPDHAFPSGRGNVIGLSHDFPCRWRYENGIMEEIPSVEHGIAGYFIFENRALLNGVPDSGEFVRWLSTRDLPFEVQSLKGARECGTLDFYSTLSKPKWRPFNTMEFSDTRVTKRPISEQGENLAANERAWYQALQDRNIKFLPKIYSFDPLVLERIDGINIYESDSLSLEEKKDLLSKIIDALKRIHSIDAGQADIASYRNAYIDKTFDRIEKVRQLIPLANQGAITINGKSCKNAFFHESEIADMVMEYLPKRFEFIHGDCTFSNMMLRKNGDPVLLDPRGYFGYTKLLGDPAYDWTKLFYSLFSNYDQFNLQRFTLDIDENEVTIEVESSGWEDLEDYFFELLQDEVDRRQIYLFLAITWLSLTTYAWNDYDSICGAFYLGLYYLQEVL